MAQTKAAKMAVEMGLRPADSWGRQWGVSSAVERGQKTAGKWAVQWNQSLAPRSASSWVAEKVARKALRRAASRAVRKDVWMVDHWAPRTVVTTAAWLGHLWVVQTDAQWAAQWARWMAERKVQMRAAWKDQR